MEQPSHYPPSSGRLNTPSVNITRKTGFNALRIPPGFGAYHQENDASLFSSSLPVLPHEKLNFVDSLHGVRSIDDASFNFKEPSEDVEGKDSNGDLDLDGIGSFLPDEDELLAGMINDFDLTGMPSQMEELEECDIFGSGGGMELDFDPAESITIGMANTSINDGYLGSVPNGTVQYTLQNGVGAVAGEHPYGEHPSRTLFVRNINSNVEDSELRSLFEQYGDIRTLYTACKHRGFVMISYYDIRAARNAMRALQNKPLRRRKLDIHFSIPKDNPSEKDINQGTLVIFNLDLSVTNDELRHIFGAYGEVKEIRETPHKRHHKFIEYYDVRAAEAALRALNRSDIAGKRIKLEPSRPGGARRNLMQQLSQDLEQDEARSYMHPMGSPILNSPPGTWAHVVSPSDNNSLRSFGHSPSFKASSSPIHSNHLPGLASILTPRMSNSVKIAPIGKDQSRVNNSPTSGVPFLSSQSFSEHSNGSVPNMSSSSGTLTSNQFLWGSPNPNSEHTLSSPWTPSSMDHSLISNGHGLGFPYSNHHVSFIPPSHHIGSAPPGMHFERQFGYFPESPDSSFMNPIGSGRLPMNMGARGSTNPGVAPPGIISSQRLGNMFVGSSPFLGPNGIEGSIERGRSRRVENNVLDSKKQYQLDLERIVTGEDTRTTLMIKNIPNKYTSKMLLAAIDEKHTGAYDFLYLPIDFKNKCNVGYAFINMVSPTHIVPFYEAFNGKKWEKFNSEKVASLAYARIQGLDALIAHFQNSSLMNEDKRCRPIIFHSEGTEVADQEPFLPNGTFIRLRPQPGSLTKNSPEGSENCGLPGRGLWNGVAILGE